MADNYSVKINRQEGSLEITGDKDWVSSKLSELKGIYSEYTPQPHKTEIPSGVTTVSNTKTSPKKSGTSTSSRPQKNPELEKKLTADIKQKLAGYMKTRQANFDASAPSQAAIIARFLQEELEWPGVDHNDMYTVYSTMGWKSPGNIRSQLNNTLSRNKYFSSITNGKYVLSLKGENYATHESVNTPKTV